MSTFFLKSPKDMLPIAQDILNEKYPSTIVLKGDLGAGKTTFVRIFLSLLDDDIIISSPTFTLMNVYETSKGIVHHFDLYRLSNSFEALEWGFDDAVHQCDFAFIEWAERAWDLIPMPYTLISIQHGNHENERTLTIKIIS